MIGGSEDARRDEQHWERSWTAGKESNEPCYLSLLLGRPRDKLDAHAEFRVHYTNPAFRLDFHVFGFQAQGNSGAFRKRRFGFDVAPSETEIGQDELRCRFGLRRRSLRCIG